MRIAKKRRSIKKNTNARILRAIKSVKGTRFYGSVCRLILEVGEMSSPNVYALELTRQYRGSKQNPHYDCSIFPITEEWVHQWNYLEDSGAGDVYIQLKEKLFLKIPYSF